MIMINKRYKYYFLFLFLFFSNQIQAADTSTTRHSIYILPLQVIGMSNSSIDFEYSIVKNRKINYVFDLGIIIPGDAWVNAVHGTGRTKGRGFQIGITPAFTIENDNANEVFGYLGLAFSYTLHNYQSNRLIPDPNISLISELGLTSYDVQQQTYSVHLRMGGDGVLKGVSKLAMGFSLGIGLRMIHVDHNSLMPIDELSSLHRLGEWIEREEKGWHQLPSIRLSWKIGLVVAKRKS
jgi:hypothetical protein